MMYGKYIQVLHRHFCFFYIAQRYVLRRGEHYEDKHI